MTVTYSQYIAKDKKFWRPGDTKLLQDLVKKNVSLPEMAQQLNRTEGAIKARIAYIREDTHMKRLWRSDDSERNKTIKQDLAFQAAMRAAIKAGLETPK